MDKSFNKIHDTFDLFLMELFAKILWRTRFEQKFCKKTCNKNYLLVFYARFPLFFLFFLLFSFQTLIMYTLFL